MSHRISLTCSCGCEFTAPRNVPVGALVPCPRCTQLLKIAGAPVTRARPVEGGGRRPPSSFGPKKRLGVPAAPGHVSIRLGDSEVLVNYGLWTLLVGVLSTLTPMLPIESPAWDAFISYQPWAGIIIAISGVLMMIAYQSAPDFARGPGAPVLVAAFWIVGITLAVFSGWVADRARQQALQAQIDEVKAPKVQPQAPPLPQFNPAQGGQERPPVQQPPPTAPPQSSPPSEPPKTANPPAADSPLGKSPLETETVEPPRKADANRTIGNVKADLESNDRRVLLNALDEIRWYFKRSEREEVAAKIAPHLAHPEEVVQEAALKAMKVWGDDADADAVIPLAAHESPAIRKEAIELLGKLQTPKSMDAIVGRLEEDTADAKTVLLKIGKTCEAAVRKGLKSKSTTTRLECLRIVEKIGARSALRDVRVMADNDKDGEIRGEARRVAEVLAKK